MKHLHLVNTDKFIEPYVNFVNKNFDTESHYFLSFTSSAENHIRQTYKNLSFQKKIIWNRKLIKSMYRSDSIYLHSLFNINIVVLLFFQPWLIKKCYWVVWGGDLYKYKSPKNSYKKILQELMRKFVIRRFSGLITHIEGDYELAKKWYNVKGDYYYSFLYPSNLFKEINTKEKDMPNPTLYIQVGNSADPSNNHIAIFERLKDIVKDSSVEIIVPLSYGNKEYIKKVIYSGRREFGENFKPILNFLSFEDYLDLISKVDVAIFNHDRQQALGNISSLISLKKKVYIRDDITTWKFCLDHSLKVFSINKDLLNVLEGMNEEIKESNYNNMKKHFSEEKLVEDWNKIFSMS